MASDVGEAEVEAARSRHAARRFSMRENEAGPELRFGDLDGIVFEDGLDEGTAANLVVWLNRMLESAKAACSASSIQDRDEALWTLHQVLAPRFSLLLSIARKLRRRAAAAERERDEARAVLRRCEWIVDEPAPSPRWEGEGRCPICHTFQTEVAGTHMGDCALAAALDPPPRGATGPSGTRDATSSAEHGHGRG